MYPEVCISTCALMEGPLPMRLELFLRTHDGWEQCFDNCTKEIRIKFLAKDTFKAFLIEFAESKRGQTMPINDAIKALSPTMKFIKES